jgi:hypothetical protein
VESAGFYNYIAETFKTPYKMKNFRKTMAYLGRLAAMTLIAAFFEGMLTLGLAFRFEEYTAIGYVFQALMFTLVVWATTEWYYNDEMSC